MQEDTRSKMVIIRKEGRSETPVSWATGDSWALQVMSKAVALDESPRAEYYWRIASPAEIDALERQRGPKGKLAGW